MENHDPTKQWEYGPRDDDGYPILTEVSKDEYTWGSFRFVRNEFGRFDTFFNGELTIGGTVGYPDKESIEQRYHDTYAYMKRRETMLTIDFQDEGGKEE